MQAITGPFKYYVSKIVGGSDQMLTFAYIVGGCSMMLYVIKESRKNGYPEKNKLIKVEKSQKQILPTKKQLILPNSALASKMGQIKHKNKTL